MLFTIILATMKMYHFLISAAALLVLGCDKGTTEAPELPVINIQGITITEGNVEAPIYIRLELSAVSKEVVTAYVGTQDGSAAAGTDYRPIAQQPVVFTPGMLIQEFKLNILGDDVAEPDETFKVRIEQVDGAVIGTAQATVTLLNDDQATTGIVVPQTGYSTPDSYSGMKLIWQDEFNAQNINLSDWTFELGTGSGGWGNNESQYYRQENTSIYQGNLVIEARKETFSGSAYTSSRIITKNGFDFQYGRVDIRAALPSGQGIWPALWMLGSNISTVGWPACGEIDIMEMVGFKPNTTHGTAHWQNASNQHQYLTGEKTVSAGSLQNEFHVYSIIWDDQQIRWYIDDQQYHSFDITTAERSEFREKFFFIFNVAVGGNWPGYPDGTTIFPQRMLVDYIRVFQPE